MKVWQKIITVCLCGAAVWGLSYAGTVWPVYAFVTSSFAAGFTALCGILTGYPSKDGA